MIDLFVTGGYGQLDQSSFGLWLNVDQALEQSRAPDLWDLTLDSFVAPLKPKHVAFVKDCESGDKARLAATCFTAHVHESRHFHDLLSTPYGSMLMRQHSLAALRFLQIKDHIVFNHNSIEVPIAEWVGSFRELKKEKVFQNLEEPTEPIVEFSGFLGSLGKKHRLFDRGVSKSPQGNAHPSTESILEASAMIIQEGHMAEKFGLGLAASYHGFVRSQPRGDVYCGALDFITNWAGRQVETDIVQYLMLVSLCGNFQERDESLVRYPSDLLLHMLVWLDRHGPDWCTLEFGEFEDLIDECFEEHFGGNVSPWLFRRARSTNKLSTISEF